MSGMGKGLVEYKTRKKDELENYNNESRKCN